MIFVDSHCHLDCLDLEKYNQHLSLAIEAARKNGVEHFLNVCITLDKISQVLGIAEEYNEVSASVGLHPNEIVADEPTSEQLIKLAHHPKIVAIGETGLDYYRSQGDVKWQRDRFRQHIRAAKSLGIPLIVHSRNAREDTLQILKEENAQEVGGVMHCFTETWEMAQQAMDLNFYISFSGIVTFSNALALQEVAKKTPLERTLIETDSPYLAPVPFRGKSNEPANVCYVAEALATLKNVELKVIAEKTTENYFTLFKRAKI